jgi:hypothetical protein
VRLETFASSRGAWRRGICCSVLRGSNVQEPGRTSARLAMFASSRGALRRGICCSVLRGSNVQEPGRTSARLAMFASSRGALRRGICCLVLRGSNVQEPRRTSRRLEMRALAGPVDNISLRAASGLPRSYRSSADPLSLAGGGVAFYANVMQPVYAFVISRGSSTVLPRKAGRVVGLALSPLVPERSQGDWRAALPR